MPALNKETVTIARCNRYDPWEVRAALEQVFSPYGGITTLIGSDKRVLLKPNLLAAASPFETVTTHPAIVKVMVEMVQEAGNRVYIGDSPGYDAQEKAHRISGLEEVIKATGAEALYFSDPVYKKIEGFRLWEIPLASELNQVDLVINLAKLKTHSLTGMTAAVKNIYGCVPGTIKARFHFEYPLPKDFSRLLLDAYFAVSPVFSLIDAVVAMEGAGPRKGRPRQVGLLMGAPCAIALDLVAAAVIGFSPEQVSTLAAAKELKLKGSNLNSIAIRGVSLEDCRVKDFDRGPASSGRFSRMLALFPFARIKDLIAARRPYPRIKTEICSGCRACNEACPAQAIGFKGSIPDIDEKNCIRCYCCQEFCSQGAIELVRR